MDDKYKTQNMMIFYAFIGIILWLIVIIVLGTLKFKGQRDVLNSGYSEESVPGERELIDVNEEITRLTGSIEYKNGSEEERTALARNLLEDLTEDGAIENVEYVEDEKMFYFTYTKDGLSGGFDLKEYGNTGIPVN